MRNVNLTPDHLEILEDAYILEHHMTARSGWLSPSGDLYPVEDFGHATAVFDLMDRGVVTVEEIGGVFNIVKKMRENGWARLSFNVWDAPIERTATKSQRRFIRDWSLFNGLDAPDFVDRRFRFKAA